MLKINYLLPLILLLSRPVIGMENPAAGHRGYQQILTAVRTGNVHELQNLSQANPNLILDKFPIAEYRYFLSP